MLRKDAVCASEELQHSAMESFPEVTVTIPDGCSFQPRKFININGL
jgi:hypothetical protein